MEKKKDTGTIKQGSIAEFMRKRTQLVGFDFGLNKHTQYAIEFVDNALDAIEAFQWKTQKERPELAFKLKDDLILENFSYSKGITKEDLEALEKKEKEKEYDDEGFELTEDGEIRIDIPQEEESPEEKAQGEEKEDKELEGEEGDETEPTEEELEEETEEETKDDAKEENEIDDDEAKELRKLQKKEKELEEEVKSIMERLENLLKPIEVLIDREPFVILKMEEKEAPAVYADMTQKSKDVYMYTFEIFDNGTGMSPEDLEKFGKYLASSKSQKLKQTRGSQGFGSPSAFSDAQNTTGQPITVVSKDINHEYGICSQFYTTSKNNKEYVVPPTEVSCVFSHGTYVRLNYLNVKYRKGYVDTYINQTALTNPHVTIIFIDPYGNESVYPRRVGRFPKQPTYALPHPSSVNIGDFQDLLRSSENLTVSAFLQENFVRLSASLARKIIQETEEELESILGYIHLDHGFITWGKKTTEPIYYCRFEERIYGRSKKPRKKLVIYKIEDESDLDKYWELITEYNKINSDIEKTEKEIHKTQKSIQSESDKKKQSNLKKKVKELEKERKNLQVHKVELKKKLKKIVSEFKLNEENEIDDTKITDKVEEIVKELLISKARPNQLTQKQTEALYKVFRRQKYMAPPTDTAIPIGASVLETTLMKEFNLSSSHRTDLFLDFEQSISPLSDREREVLAPRILAKFRRKEILTEDFSSDYLIRDTERDIAEYEELLQLYDALHTVDEDFVAGHTRPPTSGKGLAFVVEAAIALSPKIPYTKQASQTLMRYVNRTPKLRDNADCAIWKACQSVNWKNYKIETFDNGIPKGNIRILINVSGPYTHLMFKSQSKNALAEDEILMKEIKYCLEAIGRKLRNFQNRKVRREATRKRSKTIEKFIPLFVSSLMEIAMDIDEFKGLSAKELEKKILDRLHGRIKEPQITPPKGDKKASETKTKEGGTLIEKETIRVEEEKEEESIERVSEEEKEGREEKEEEKKDTKIKKESTLTKEDKKEEKIKKVVSSPAKEKEKEKKDNKEIDEKIEEEKRTSSKEVKKEEKEKEKEASRKTDKKEEKIKEEALKELELLYAKAKIIKKQKSELQGKEKEEEKVVEEKRPKSKKRTKKKSRTKQTSLKTKEKTEKSSQTKIEETNKTEKVSSPKKKQSLTVPSKVKRLKVPAKKRKSASVGLSTEKVLQNFEKGELLTLDDLCAKLNVNSLIDIKHLKSLLNILRSRRNIVTKKKGNTVYYTLAQ